MSDMNPQELAAKLAELDEDFAAAPEDSDPFELPEPGIYQGILREIGFFEAKTTGDPFLKLCYEITLDPTYAGRVVEAIYNLGASGTPEDRQRRLGFLKKDLKKLGIDPDAEDFSLGLLYPGSPIWDQVLDAPCELAIVESRKINQNTGRPYKNLYLNQRLGDPLSDIPSDGVPAVSSLLDDSDIPFRWEGPKDYDMRYHSNR